MRRRTCGSYGTEKFWDDSGDDIFNFGQGDIHVFLRVAIFHKYYLLAARARPPEHVPDPATAAGFGAADPKGEEGPAPHGEEGPPIDEDLITRQYCPFY